MSEQILHQSQSFSQIKFTYIAIPMVGYYYCILLQQILHQSQSVSQIKLTFTMIASIPMVG